LEEHFSKLLFFKDCRDNIKSKKASVQVDLSSTSSLPQYTFIFHLETWKAILKGKKICILIIMHGYLTRVFIVSTRYLRYYKLSP